MTMNITQLDDSRLLREAHFHHQDHPECDGACLIPRRESSTRPATDPRIAIEPNLMRAITELMNAQKSQAHGLAVKRSIERAKQRRLAKAQADTMAADD